MSQCMYANMARGQLQLMSNNRGVPGGKQLGRPHAIDRACQGLAAVCLSAMLQC
jgi:hypothetical protein